MPAVRTMVATASSRSSPGAGLSSLGRQAGVLVTVACYSVLAPFGYAVLALLCLLWRRDPPRRARRLQTITSRAYRVMHGWLRLSRLVDFDWSSAWSARSGDGVPRGGCVVIANHPTLVDVTAITAALGGAISIVKPGLFRRAMIRPLLVGLGHVEGPGPDPIRAGRVVDDVVQHLSWGIPVVIFPEGTRSPAGDLGAFGRVAFEIACRAQVPLVSLGITCDPVYLSKERGPFRPPPRTPRLRIELLAVDAPEPEQSSRSLRARCEARYRAWIGEVAAGARGS